MCWWTEFLERDKSLLSAFNWNKKPYFLVFNMSILKCNKILALTLPRIQAQTSMLMFTQLSCKAVGADIRIFFSSHIAGRKQYNFSFLDQMLQNKIERRWKNKETPEPKKAQMQSLSISLIQQKEEQERVMFSHCWLAKISSFTTILFLPLLKETGRKYDEKTPHGLR